ncbi:MAG: Crp/Fnr family transcriptional regulator [Bacteroidota bacterium]
MDPSCTCELCELKELFFGNLERKYADVICSGKVEKEFSKGETIIREDTHISDFVYLKSGLVKLYKRGDDRTEQIISIAKPFDYVSLLSVFSTNLYNYSVTALEDSVTCNLKMDVIRSIVKENGPLALSLLQKMSRVADAIILDSLRIRKKHLRGRVAFLLIRFATEVYFSNEFELPLSRKEMAEYVGMTTENVIRSLSEFRKDGILKIYGKTIQIVNMKTLKSISEFG